MTRLAPLEITSPLPEKGEKIKSISGRMLTWCNQTKSVRCILNPNNEKMGSVSKTAGKIARFIPRFIIGLFAGIVGGACGALWHLGGAIVSENHKKHFASFLADLGRVSTGGLLSAFGYGFNPDLYFAKGDTRSDGTVPRKDSLPPAKEEWHALLLLLRHGIDLLAAPALFGAL